MKKLLFVLFSLSLLALSGCNPADQYAISYKINGSPWYAGSAPTFLANGRIAVNAVSTNQSQYITVFDFSQLSVGTHSLNKIDNGIYYPDTTGFYFQPSNPGTLVISKFDSNAKNISGTFSGKMYNAAKSDSITITEGKFDLHYQQ